MKKTKGESVTQTITDKWNALRVFCRNVAEFMDAAALATVSGYSIHEAIQHIHKSNWYKGLLFAGVLIALQAALLLIKHFNRQAEA